MVGVDMKDSILAVAQDAIAIIGAMGRTDVAQILQNRINVLMSGDGHER